MKRSDLIREFADALGSYLARSVPVDLPRYRADAVPISTAHDLAVAANLSVTEARHRMKDMYGDAASHPVCTGVGTVLGRAQTLSRPKRKRKKKRGEEAR